MKHSILGGIGAAILLGACGGGGGGATGSGASQPPATPAVPAPAPAPAPTIYRLPVRSALDVASYRAINTALPGPLKFTSYHTDAATSTSASGAALMSFTATDTRSYGNAIELNTSGGLVQDFSVGVDHACRYAPVYFAVPASVAAGTSWDNSATKTCTSSYQTLKYDVRSQGGFVAFEAVTIGTGTYDTVKLHYVETIKSTTSSDTIDRIEWRDLITGLVVKSTVNELATNSSPQTTNSFTQDLELIGYTQAASGRSKPNVERYVGSWWGTFVDAGISNGPCSLKLAGSGSITGYCPGQGFTNWQVAGTVNAEGAATMNLIANGLPNRTFTGTFTPLAAAGTWVSATGSGSWKLTHD